MSIQKEESLNNLEEVKKYIQEAENKKEEKVVGIAIKNRFTGLIIFQSTKTTYREAVIESLASEADLRYANLSNADLSNADLSGVNLSGAEMRNVKFYGRGGTRPLKRSQLPDFLAALGFVIED